MQKYFINKEEVDQEEFNAELTAQTHAYFDENFEELLNDLSDNYDKTFYIGNFEFSANELFRLLPQEMQDEIEEYLFEDLIECHFDNVEMDGKLDIFFENEVIHFEIQELDEE